MANLGGTFNAGDVDPLDDFSPIPVGKYEAMVTESSLNKTKDGKGEFLLLVFEIIDGDYKGRKIWNRLNIVNANDQAVQIAQKHLSSICRAAGKMQVDDSDQLHNLPMVIKVAIEPAKDGYQASNKINAYEEIDTKTGASETPKEPEAAVGAGVSSQGPVKPPWAK